MLIEIILVVTIKPYPPNNGNCYGDSYNANWSVPTDLENVLNDFITTQRAFNKIVEEKLKNLIDLLIKWRILLMILKFKKLEPLIFKTSLLNL